MFFDTVADLLKHKHGQSTYALPPTSSAAEAIRLMTRHGIGAVLVTSPDGLEGIVTDRDVMTRVVEPGRDPASTRLDEVMTSRPRTVRAGDRAARALDLMTKDGYRHVPVVDGRAVLGVLSMRDLNAWLMAELREQADGALMAVKTMGLANRGR